MSENLAEQPVTTAHYDPQTFRSSSGIGYLLKLSHTLMHERADRVFASQDINFVQWIALVKLREGIVRTASELCRSMCHDNGAITRMLDQLEQRGYLERNRSQQDRRVVELVLTRAGEQKVDELKPQLVMLLNETLSDFSAAEFAELTRLLNKLIAVLQAGESANEGAVS